MRELYFDVWAGDDLLGTSLGELTDASAKKITKVDNGMGSGEFTISRHSAQYDWVTPGPTTPEPLIRCRRIPGGPFEADNDEYFFAFFVEEGQDALTSPDEEGGEDSTRSGRSIESILSRAVVNEVATYADDIVNHPYDKTTLKDGQWHMDEDIPGSFSNAGTPGAVLRIFLRNAGSQTPEPIPEVTHDFNINNDSNGDPWPDGDAKWSFDVGTSLLDVLGILVNGGLFYEMSAAFVLSAYGTQQGADRTADVIFTHGTDIATSGDRTIHASPAKSRLLVKGQTDEGVRKFRWVADTGIEAVLGVRQGSLDYQASPTNAILDKAGNKKLADLKNQHDGPPTMGVDESAGEEAFFDYIVGHTVTVDIPGVYSSEAARIHSITLQETETGEVDVIIEFNGEAWSGVDAPLTATAEAHDEFWYDAGEDNGGPPEVMRMRDYGTSFYHKAGASHWDDDNDAYIALDASPGDETSSVDIFAFNQSAANYSEIILENGEFFMLASRIWDAEMDGTDPATSKFYFFGGFGIVLESASTDDDPTGGEAGQIIYRNSSNSFRWFNGSIWQDFGTSGGGEGGFYETVVGDSVATVFDITHGLSTSAVEVELWDLSGTLAIQVMADIEIVDLDTVRVTTTPTVVDTGGLRVVVVGVTIPSDGVAGDSGGSGGSSPAGPVYGTSIAMDSLANTRVGYSSQQSSYRFRAEQSSPLDSITIYIIFNGNTGYSNGTGGTLRARLRADDGTADHHPTGSNLATASVTPGNPASDDFPTLTFGTPYTPTAGTLYHIHFDNTDGSPGTNYGSLDAVWLSDPPALAQPKYANTDWFQLFSDDNGSTWSDRTGYTPIMDIAYGNGEHQGVGYMEISHDEGAGEIGTINGTNDLIREVITVSGGSRTVTAIGVRFWRESGSQDVTARLETDAEVLIEAVTIPGASFVTESDPPPADPPSGAGSWGSADFLAPHVLTNGSTYHVVFSTGGSSTYKTVVVRKGVDYGLDSATYFLDGVAEKSSDGGSSWDSLGRVDDENDIQFYLVTP